MLCEQRLQLGSSSNPSRDNRGRDPRRSPQPARRRLPAPGGGRRPHARGSGPRLRRRPAGAGRAAAVRPPGGCTGSRACAAAWRACRSAWAARNGSTTRASTCATTSATRSLPAPGGDAELQRLAGELLGRPLHRDRPLWELTLVEGLAPDASGGPRFALVSKMHHALVDGVAGVDLVSLLLGPDRGAAAAADGDGPDGAGRPWIPRHEPTPAALLARAWGERARTACRALRELRELGADRDRPRRAVTGDRTRRGRAGRDGARSVRGAAFAAERPDRPAPPPDLGRRRPRRARRGPERARGDPQRRRAGRRVARPRPLAARRWARHGRPRAQGIGPGLRARAGRERRARQPRCGHVGPAAGRRARPARRVRGDPRRDDRAEGLAAGRRRPGADAARGARPAGRARPRRPPAVPPAPVQRRGHQRAGPPRAAGAARPQAAGDPSRGPAGRQPGARRSPWSATTGPRASGCWPTPTRWPTSTRSPARSSDALAELTAAAAA